MKLRVKALAIGTGNPLIAIMNYIDAIKYDLHYADRIAIRKSRNQTIAMIDITDSNDIVMPGEIGLFIEVCGKLKAETLDTVDIHIQEKPRSLHFIKKKLRGIRLSQNEWKEIIKDIVADKLSEIELSYLVSASYIRELSDDEIVGLTKAMINTGETLKFDNRIIVDKHCIGGVAGNRTTMMVVPIVAAAGLTIPKTSSRSITSAAGTSDTVEVLCNVSFSIDKMKKIVAKTGGCLVWGGSMNLAPADDKIIKVEHPMSLDPVGQLVASILAKKKSVSATHVLIDIPVGKGTKTESRQRAELLRSKFELIGNKIGMKVKVVITDGSMPIGRGIGPALEARDVLWTLTNHENAALDLREKSIFMAGEIFEMAGKAKSGMGKKLAQDILDSGLAYRKFIDIIKAQGAKTIYPDDIELGSYTSDFLASRSGTIRHMDNKAINKIARLAGAPHDHKAGVFLHKNKGSKVKKGEPIFRIYADSKDRLRQAREACVYAKPVEIR